MKVFARISGLSTTWQGQSLLQQLWDEYPQGQCGGQRHFFRLDLDFEDVRTQRVIKLLQTNGLQPWDYENPIQRDKEYTFYLERQYETSELVRFKFLELKPGGDGFVKGWARSEGHPTAIMEHPGKWDICRLGPAVSFIAVQRARDALEGAGLQGLKFRPVIKKYNSIDYDLYDEDDTWWEIDTDVVLPPVSASMTLLTRLHQPHPRDLSEGCYRREGFYLLPELYYRRADLERLAPFDVARTYEYFGAPTPFDRAMIVSRRFYEICLENNIRSQWIPVHLED